MFLFYKNSLSSYVSLLLIGRANKGDGDDESMDDTASMETRTEGCSPFIRFVSFFTKFTWISEPIFWETNFAVSIKPTLQSLHNLSFAI